MYLIIFSVIISRILVSFSISIWGLGIRVKFVLTVFSGVGCLHGIGVSVIGFSFCCWLLFGVICCCVVGSVVGVLVVVWVGLGFVCWVFLLMLFVVGELTVGVVVVRLVVFLVIVIDDIGLLVMSA